MIKLLHGEWVGKGGEGEVENLRGSHLVWRTGGLDQREAAEIEVHGHQEHFVGKINKPW